MTIQPAFTPKHPNDVDFFTIVLDKWLHPNDTLMNGATVTTDPPDMTVVSVTQTSDSITAKLGGGSAGTTYKVSYTYQTSLGRDATRSINVDVAIV